eukprot:9389595-Pyramimonas_sp.AAC.1
MLSSALRLGPTAPPVGLHAAIKPSFSPSTAGKFLNSPPKYLRVCKCSGGESNSTGGLQGVYRGSTGGLQG